jgi:hypothetical protein
MNQINPCKFLFQEMGLFANHYTISVFFLSHQIDLVLFIVLSILFIRLYKINIKSQYIKYVHMDLIDKIINSKFKNNKKEKNISESKRRKKN